MFGSLIKSILNVCRPMALVKWVVVFICALVLWVALNHATLRQYFAQRERRDTHVAEVKHLKQVLGRLDQERQQLRTGGFEAEKAIRERFYFVRPGEKVIFIETPTPAPPPEIKQQDADSDAKSPPD